MQTRRGDRWEVSRRSQALNLPARDTTSREACFSRAGLALVAVLALGPGRRSEFFDPKVRVMPRPIEVRRGKSGHRRAGCRASFTASAGATFQGVATDSVTENIPPVRFAARRRARARVKRWGKSPPRRRRRRRHEKPLPVQGKIGGWAARPIATGMPHPAAPRAAWRKPGGAGLRGTWPLRRT